MFSDVFRTEIGHINLYTMGQHLIRTSISSPVRHRNGRIPISQENIIEKEIEKHLKLGIIKPSNNPWWSRIVIVSNKENEWRMCIDYRHINQVTTRDNYMSPRIDEIYDSLVGENIFSILDSTSGYYQLAIDDADKEKTAFSFKGRLYKYNRMPFGLCNAPASFQRAMDRLFERENHKFVISYLDDIIVYSKTSEEHYQHLLIVFGKIRASGLSLNENKCKFFKNEVKILRNIIGNNQIKIDGARAEAI